MTVNKAQVKAILDTIDQACLYISSTQSVCTIANWDASIKATIPSQGELAETLYDTKLLKKVISVSKDSIVFEDSLVNGISCTYIVTTNIEKITENFPHSFEVSLSRFKDIVQLLTPFVSEDETRYSMTGVYLEHSEGDFTINFVATNGRTLGVVNLEEKQYTTLPTFKLIAPLHSFILPKKVEGTLKILFNNKRIGLELVEEIGCISYKRSTTLIEGQFPNYRKVIPECNNTIQFDNVLLNITIKTLLPFASKKSGYPSRLSIDNNVMLIEVLNEEKTVVASKEIACKSDKDFTCKLDLKYLQDITYGTDKVLTLKYIDNTHAFSIKTNDTLRILIPMLEKN